MRRKKILIPILLLGSMAVATVKSLAYDQAWQEKNRQGIQMRMEGKFAAAEALMRDALKIAESLGPESQEKAISTNNLGSFYLSMYRLDESRNQFLVSSKIWATVFDETTPNTPLGNLAQVYLELGEFKKAEETCNQCLRHFNKNWEEENPTLKPRLLQCRADVAISKKRYSEATKILNEVLTLENQSGVWDALDLSTIYDKLGTIEALGKRWNSAKMFFERSADFAEQSKIPCPLLEAKVDLNVGFIDCQLSEYRAAEIVIEKAHGIIEEYFGGNHPLNEYVFRNLALLYKKMKRREDAQRCERQARIIHAGYAAKSHSDYLVNAKDLDSMKRSMR